MRASAVAYITSAYPHVSHSFILNEVTELRRRGVQVETFVVRATREEEILSVADRHAAETTYAIRPPKLCHFAAAHLRGVMAGRRYWRTLGWALRRSSSPRSLLWQLAYFVQAVVLWNRVRLTGIRHIHAHFANVSSDLAMLAAGLGGPQWSWSFTMHGPTEFEDQRFFRLAEKTRSADFVVCISDFCRSQLMALVEPALWEKFHIVHCGVDTDWFVPARRSRHDSLRVLCVGRFAPVKGHPILLEALAKCRSLGTQIEAILVGDGPSRGEIEAIVSRHALGDSVSLAGAVGRDDIFEYFARADVFVLASFAEGVPVVLMEAMSAGLPVISSRIAGVPELVQDGVSGILITPGRSDEILRALIEMAEQPERRIAIGGAARNRVLAEFEVRACAAELHRVFARRLGWPADAPAESQPSPSAVEVHRA